jgi:hypothetical protein
MLDIDFLELILIPKIKWKIFIINKNYIILNFLEEREKKFFFINRKKKRILVVKNLFYLTHLNNNRINVSLKIKEYLITKKI